MGSLYPNPTGGLTASDSPAAFFAYLVMLGRLSGQLPLPKFNSCISPCGYLI